MFVEDREPHDDVDREEDQQDRQNRGHEQGQMLPAYWIGVGMRCVFLPDAAAAIEIGQTWRLLEATAVPSAWALGGILVAPAVLRLMARRESGASVEASRQEALQRM
jgi:ABC-2 type transport system permease protein